MHTDYMVLIVEFYTVPMPFHNVKTFLIKRALSNKHASIFYRENITSFLNYVTATLRVPFAWRGCMYYYIFFITFYIKSIKSSCLLHVGFFSILHVIESNIKEIVINKFYLL